MITTIYSKSQPNLEGLTFDAIFSESMDAGYESTDYSVETGDTYQDHIRKLPKMITMRVASTDTPFRDILGRIVSTGMGYISSQLPPLVTAGASVGAQLFNASNGSGSTDTRSAKAWQSMIKAADSRPVFSVVTTKGIYDNYHIRRIYYECTPENENAIDIVIEMKELRQFQSGITSGQPTKSQLREGTSESVQAAPPSNLGSLSVEPV